MVMFMVTGHVVFVHIPTSILSTVIHGNGHCRCEGSGNNNA